MNSSINASNNPFLSNKIENLCLICRKVLTACQYASVQDVLPRITPQINLMEALKLLSNFAQLHIDTEQLRTCTMCFLNVQQLIHFQNECNRSVEYIKEYITQPHIVKTEVYEHVDIGDVKITNIDSSNDNEDKVDERMKNKLCDVYNDGEEESNSNIENIEMNESSNDNENSLDEEVRNRLCAVYNEDKNGSSSKLEDVDPPKSLSLDKKPRYLMNRSIKKECPHCHKMYRHDYMRIHIRTHTGELPYPCKHCDKRFSCRSGLNAHIFVHEDKREFLCTCCGRSFRKRSDLNIHMRTHTGEKPYACEVCGRTFHTYKKRKCHMVTHSDEKPFACIQCPKKFSRMALLKQHKVVHAAIKPIECTFCERRFSQKHVLRTHQAKSCPGRNLS